MHTFFGGERTSWLSVDSYRRAPVISSQTPVSQSDLPRSLSGSTANRRQASVWSVKMQREGALDGAGESCLSKVVGQFVGDTDLRGGL